MEDQVIESLPTLFCSQYPAWMAGSLPLGAGIPDLIVASYRPLALGLAGAGRNETNILAYLRAVGRARPDTIASRLNLSARDTDAGVRSLLAADALINKAGTVSLAPVCRDVLPEVTAIEVKIDDWRRALGQALRNRVFAHRSFIALPKRAAANACRAPAVLASGVGVIAVDPDSGPVVVRPATKSLPKVWTYYYRLAAIIGQHHPGVAA